MGMTGMSKAVEGVRVIDFTQVLAGPFAATQLALLGADVIKIEQPGVGDQMRSLTSGGEWAPRGMAPAFLGANTGKRGMTLDLKHAGAKEILRRLIEGADVLIENFRPGVMQRLGLTYDEVKAIKPDLVYCSISGYGQTGPKSKLPAYDGAVQASSGIMSVTGHAETGPVRVGFMVVDMSTAVTAAFAIASALYRRLATGEGQHLDVAMNDSAIQMMNPIISRYLIDGQIPELIGNLSQTRQGTAHTWPTKDGHISIAVITDRMVPALCRGLGHPEWAETPRFATSEGRVEHAETVYGEIAEVLAGDTTAAWEERLGGEGVPAAPVNDLPATLNEPQISQRGILMQIATPQSSSGKVTLPGVGFIANEGSPGADSLAPELGQHTEEVLLELGYGVDDIAALRADAVI